MSLSEEKILELNVSYDNLSVNKDLKIAFKESLSSGMHGLCFSPYMEGQEPGTYMSETQIRRRIEIIKPYTKWIRSFSTTQGNELIPRIAKEYGIKTFVGAWLGDDLEINEREMANLIDLANEGLVDIASVGNEVMYRGDLTEEKLIEYINQAKEAIKDIPVGYVDSYYEFVDRPQITEACDVILANCYPFWEGCSHDHSLLSVNEMYKETVKVAKGKKVIVAETGWPNMGTCLESATPSRENAMKYFINSQKWAKDKGVEMFYFSSFDETWKTETEGDVGAFWGIWDKFENLKY